MPASAAQAWKGERVVQLKKALEVDGLSASEAGDRFGVSRNAIVGAAHRNHIQFKRKKGYYRPQNYERKAQARERAINRPRAQKIRYRLNGPPQPLETASASAPAPLKPHEVAKYPCTLMQLSQSRCHFPLGGLMEPVKLYCGDATQSTYCGFHARIVYQPPRYR